MMCRWPRGRRWGFGASTSWSWAICIFQDPAQPLYVTGSLDSVTGTYAFQGRRFDVDPTSSINFRGELTPEVFITVKRVISGVEARVTIAGQLSEPEIRLASTPPLESSDILSLIVFTLRRPLSATQQADLAVRACIWPPGSRQPAHHGASILPRPSTFSRSKRRETAGPRVLPSATSWRPCFSRRFIRQFGGTNTTKRPGIRALPGFFGFAPHFPTRERSSRGRRSGGRARRIDLIVFSLLIETSTCTYPLDPYRSRVRIRSRKGATGTFQHEGRAYSSAIRAVRAIQSDPAMFLTWNLPPHARGATEPLHCPCPRRSPATVPRVPLF